MVTKYNVGETVLLKGTIKSINIANNGDITYTITLPGRSSSVAYKEHDIYSFDLCKESEEEK